MIGWGCPALQTEHRLLVAFAFIKGSDDRAQHASKRTV